MYDVSDAYYVSNFRQEKWAFVPFDPLDKPGHLLMKSSFPLS
jgi:hypothetical protein